MTNQTKAILTELANRVRAQRRIRRQLVKMYREAAGGWPFERPPVPFLLVEAAENEAWGAFQAAKKVALDTKE